MVTDSIDVLCLNVCGLKSILLYSDFRDLIASKDILIFLESKSDEFDVFDVPSGYCFFAKNRSNLSKKSGGIVIVYKESLTKYLNFPKSSSEFVQWLIIQKR